MLYLCAPLYWSDFRWFMGALLTVEINTWFLILRRCVYKRQEKVHPVLIDVVSFCFYTSWLIIRCFIFPWILVTFLRMAHDEIQRTGIFWHWPMVFLPVHFFLCVLQLKWSYDLFQPIIRRWLTADSSVVTISSGL
jgi:hypothetical protein